MKKEVTIVTAFQNLGRDKWEGEKNGEVIPSYIKRDVNTYIERFKRLLKLNNKIILFCEEDIRERIGEHDNLVYVSIESVIETQFYTTLKDKIQSVQKNERFINLIEDKASPEYWSPEYILINLLKSSFVVKSLEMNLIKEDDATAWIDFGYCREDVDAPEGKTFVFDTEEKINLFMNGDVGHDLIHRPIFDLVKTGHVLIQGSHVISNTKHFVWLHDMMNISLNKLLNVGLVDDDQTLLLMCLRHYSKYFKLHLNSNTDWFNVIRNNCV